MEIVQLDIQGFRSLKNVSWRPGDLNVIIGPNGSGKSNLLRAPEMISAAARGRLSNHIIASGGIGALVWDGRGDTIAWKLLVSPEIPSPDTTPLNHEFLYNAGLIRLGMTNSYRVRDEVLERIEFDGSADQAANTTKQLVRHNRTAKTYSDVSVPQDLSLDAIVEEETLLSQVASPFANNPWLRTVRGQMETWSVYHDVRVDQGATVRQSPVARKEERVERDGQNLINVLHTLYMSDRDFKQDINDAMYAAFGRDFDELIFPPDAGDQRIQLKIRWKTLQREQSASELSDGTLRFLFLLTVLARPTAPVIAIDGPEMGLHPSMLPIVAEFAAEASRRVQVIFTTHSDRFLDAFRDVRPTITVAKLENGETTLTTLDDKELAYWVEGYTLGSLFRSGELENMAS